jgi:uncharacterized Fe-S cluster-containing radical SAM superfamily protein
MEKQSACEDFIHPVLNEEVRTISGYYMLGKEKRLFFRDREVLYYLGCAVVDSSCCGPGGFTYALVPGYIEQWKYKMSSDDRWVTQVKPLRDKADQEKLRRLIKEKELVQQVNFE